MNGLAKGLVALLVLLVVAGFGLAAWQWQRANTTNETLSSVNTTNATLEAANATLEADTTTVAAAMATVIAENGQLAEDTMSMEELSYAYYDLATTVTVLEEENKRLQEELTAVATPTATPSAGGDDELGGIEPPAEVLTVMERIEDEVIELRGIPEQRPVERRFLTREDLRAYIVRETEEESSPDEYRHSAQILGLMGFAERDLDLKQLFIDLQTEQIAGFYDPEIDSFYLIGEEPRLSGIDQITYAHEFGHNLQDQLVDLDAILDAYEYDSDGGLAVRALVEGDATLLMTQWLEEYLINSLSPEELREMLGELSESQDSPVLDSVPAIIRESLTFPYEEGAVFVQELYEQGGWEAVDAALQDPPVSSEQILHPEKYLASPRELPTPPPFVDLSSALGDGWTVAVTDTLGEFDVVQWAEAFGTDADADELGAGIGGISYTLYEQSATQTPLLHIAMSWDTATDGDAFLAALQEALTGGDDPLQARTGAIYQIKGAGERFEIVIGDSASDVEALLNALP